MAGLITQRSPHDEAIRDRIKIPWHETEFTCFTLGRDPRSHLLLAWDGISRAHAWIDYSDGRFELVCNGGGNGTFLNGRRVSRAELAEGDLIGFGHGHDVPHGSVLHPSALVYEFSFLTPKGFIVQGNEVSHRSSAWNKHHLDADAPITSGTYSLRHTQVSPSMERHHSADLPSSSRLGAHPIVNDTTHRMSATTQLHTRTRVLATTNGHSIGDRDRRSASPFAAHEEEVMAMREELEGLRNQVQQQHRQSRDSFPPTLSSRHTDPQALKDRTNRQTAAGESVGSTVGNHDLHLDHRAAAPSNHTPGRTRSPQKAGAGVMRSGADGGPDRGDPNLDNVVRELREEVLQMKMERALLNQRERDGGEREGGQGGVDRPGQWGLLRERDKEGRADARTTLAAPKALNGVASEGGREGALVEDDACSLESTAFHGSLQRALEAQLAVRDRAIADLRSKTNAQEEEIARMTSDLKHSELRASQLQALSATAPAVQAELASKTEAVKAMEEGAEALTAQLEETKRELDEMRARAVEVEGLLAVEVTRREGLESTVRAREEERDLELVKEEAAKAARAEEKKELEEAREKMEEELRTMAGQHGVERARLQEELARAVKGTKEDVKAEREVASQLRAEVQNKDQQLKTQKEKFTAIMDKAKARMQEAVVRNDLALANAQAEGKEHQAQADLLRRELEEIRAGQNENCELNERIRKKDRTIAEQKEVVSRLKTEVASLQGDAVSAELKLTQEALAAKEREMGLMKETHGAEKRRLESKMQAALSTSQAELKTAQRIASTANTSLMSANEAKDKLQEEVTALQKELKAVKARGAKEENARMKAMSEEVGRVREGKDKLESELKECREATARDKETIAKLKARAEGLAAQVDYARKYEGKNAQAPASPPAANLSKSVNMSTTNQSMSNTPTAASRKARGGVGADSPNVSGVGGGSKVVEGKPPRDLIQQLSEQAMELEEWKAKHAFTQSEVARLRQQLTGVRDLQGQLTEAEERLQRMASLEAELALERQRTARAEAKLKQDKETPADVSALNREINSLQCKLSKAEEDARKAESKLQSVGSGEKAKEEYLQALLQTHEQELQELKRGVQEWEDKAKKYKTEAVRLSEEMDRSRGRVAELERVLVENKALQDESKVLRDEVTRSQDAKAALEQELRVHREKLAALQREMAVVKEQAGTHAPAEGRLRQATRDPADGSKPADHRPQSPLPPSRIPRPGSSTRLEPHAASSPQTPVPAAAVHATPAASHIEVDPDLDRRPEEHGPTALQGHTDVVAAICTAGPYLFSASSDTTIGVWTLRDLSLARRISTPSKVVCVAAAAKGDVVAGAGGDSMVRLWQTESGAAVASLSGHAGELKSLAFSSDPTLLASGATDKTILLWRRAGGADWAQDLSLKGHGGSVTAVAFSPAAATLLASGSYDRSIRLWDCTTGTELGKLSGHSHWVMSMSFSLDGSMLASGSYDRTVRTWNIEKRELTQTLASHKDRVTSVAFHGGSQRIVSGSYDKQVRVWDLGDGGSSRLLAGHQGEVKGVCSAAHHGLILSAGSDRKVLAWRV